MERKTYSKKQAFTQITLPVILSVIFVVALIVLLLYLSESDPFLPAKMADLVIMTIVFFLFVFGLVTLFMLIKSIEAVNEGIRKLPEGIDKANDAIDSVNPIITEVLNKSLEPVVGIKSWLAGISHFFKRND